MPKQDFSLRRKKAFSWMPLFILSICVTAQQPQSGISQPGSPPQVSTSNEDLKSKMTDATALFQKGDYAHALSIFYQVTAAEPANIVAHNMAGNCSLQLKDYPGAIASFKRALELQPGEWHNEAGLMQAYSLSGMTKERDSQREELRQLKTQNRLPQNFHFLVDSFEVGDKRVEVVEFYPDLAGGYHYRYWFNLLDSSGKQVYRIALESDDIDQVNFAKSHPKEAAAGQREFSMDGYGSNTHSTYRFYDGEPSFEQVREEAKQAFLGSMKASSSTTFNGGQPSETKKDSTPKTADTPK